ncbi:hypothetical protein GCM10011416_16050 [Polaribacter pacificus]|uniref:DUF6249 domain-containing protein n=1 Tax=Polaribacter pacificus TaxID=1775173 RepID=A0A917I093_9FLAO|nr:DUF6249 domain-containing protein [Polaribacter pacificus]GGG98638.1 hypothetical protein GCM10011416_16050 [Polaribacter pacificus]
MNEFGIDAFTLLGLFIIVLIIIIYLAWMIRYKAKAAERLLIIEKNFDASKLLTKKSNNSNLLKGGIILLSSTVGAVIGILIFSIFSTGIEETVILIISTFMFAGIGMIIGNLISKSKKED